MFPTSFLRRVPGLDVAFGVTAYQLADTAKMLVVTALRSGRTTARVARSLQNGLIQLWKYGVAPSEHDTEVARQAARGALHAVDETPAEIEQLADQAVVGIVHALDKSNISPYDALRGAAYGVVEGASETSEDLGRATTGAIAGAKETAQSLHLHEEKATQQAARGALEAAQTLGSQAVSQVKQVLPDELIVEPSAHQEENGGSKKTQDKSS
jgi:hypothetical protein